MEPAAKICPSCREEFLHTVEVCPECEVELVAPDLLPRAGDDQLPSSSELVRVRAENPTWIAALADRLAQEGIPSRVEGLEPGATPRHQRSPCALFVRPEDAERASAIDAELLRSQLPDLPEAASLGWEESEACPACGTPIGAEENECSDCGLVFAPAEEE